MALISLVRHVKLRVARRKYALIALGIFGAALFYGDALITPAISVLSAMEGIQVAAPGLDRFVIPATIAIITLLFAIQRFGTGVVSNLFAPVMMLWFGVLAVLGVSHIAGNPGVLAAASPHHAISFLIDHPHQAFLALGSVVLAVTGAEALYADMGHFGRRAIRSSWFFVVFPALVLNYFGQGAMLLQQPELKTNPFFFMAPGWAQIPMVVLAAMAAVIASQAVISGAFSITRQAIRLDFLPLLDIRHTSRYTEGQVYVPVVNWTLYVAIVGLVIGFQSSTALAGAYGIAVTGTLAIDTVLAFFVMRFLWHRRLSWVLSVGAAFLVVDLAFFSANLTKILHGGWFPIVVAVVLFTMLMTWQRGRSLLVSNRLAKEGSLQDFVNGVDSAEHPPLRVPGTAVFLSASDNTAPLALRYNAEHNKVLHETVIVLTVETIGRPSVPVDERVTIDDLAIPDDGIFLVRARFGFSDRPDVPAALCQAVVQGLDAQVDTASYFLTKSSLRAVRSPEMAFWRKRLFVAMNRNAGSATRYFHLPADRVVTLGSYIEV